MEGLADLTGTIPVPFVVVPDPDRPGVHLLRGELDLAGAPALSWALRDVDGAPGHRVVLDLSDLAFIDATGIRAVEQARARLRRQGAEVVVRHPQPPVLRALALCGLDGWLEAAVPAH